MIKKVVFCKKDAIGKCTHELYPGMFHLELFTPGFEECSLYGIEETSIVRRGSDWPGWLQRGGLPFGVYMG